jgi:hypothetical protein
MAFNEAGAEAIDLQLGSGTDPANGHRQDVAAEALQHRVRRVAQFQQLAGGAQNRCRRGDAQPVL